MIRIAQRHDEVCIGVRIKAHGEVASDPYFCFF